MNAVHECVGNGNLRLMPISWRNMLLNYVFVLTMTVLKLRLVTEFDCACLLKIYYDQFEVPLISAG